MKYEETVDSKEYEDWKRKNSEMLNKLYFSEVKEEVMVRSQDVRGLYLTWKVAPQRTKKDICESALVSSV